MHDIIKMCSFEGTKSTKGASKMRRDLLNAEIGQLRDLLPLPPSTRQRLSQLQLMALVCVYVRKSNYFQQALKQSMTSRESPNIEFLKALSGFLMMLTQGGKLLYISDNAAEYLGHSMEDLLIHGDSVFDIIDKQDHSAVQSELVRGAQSAAASPLTEDDRLFLCRMNVSRNARRQMRFGDQKVVLVQGHYLSYLPLCSRNEPVFLAQCTPVAMPETRECIVQGATNVFTSIHTLDMKFISLDRNGEFYLGYSPSHLAGVSWYHLLHPDCLKEAQAKHRLITSSEQDRACILLLRLQTSGGSWTWIHCVLQVKDSVDSVQVQQQPTQQQTQPQAQTSQQTQQPQQETSTSSSTSTSTSTTTQAQTQQPVIVATNQVLSDKEAAVLRANSWLYHYYAMQSKLQYGLAYDTHAQRVHAAYYPPVMPYQADPTTAHYMNSPLNGGTMHPHPVTHSSTTPYTLAATNPYLQPYHHPYSVRLHHGLEYSRDSPSWSYYDPSTSSDPSTTAHQFFHHTQQTSSPTYMGQTGSLKPQRRTSPTKSSPRRSPTNTPTPQGVPSEPSTGGVAVITPVAVRPTTVVNHSKSLSPGSAEETETPSWKSSPTQEVPEYYEYPYITPPYSSTPTKSTSFLFDPHESKDVLIKDQRVPSIERSEPSWAEAHSRPWLPSEEITGPLRVLNHGP